MSCPICCNKYNKSLNLKITCPIDTCNFDVCKSCIRQYLVNTTKDPNCMKCNTGWSQQFVINSLNKSYWDKEYKVHRCNILTDTEISKIPDTIEYAEQYNNIQNLKLEADEKLSEIREVKNSLRKLTIEHTELIRKIRVIQNGESSYTKKKFIMPCQNAECKGYLSTQYKCGLCEMFTCPDCFEVLGKIRLDNHICNEDSKKTAEEIKKNTKGCPNCGQRIYKIEGCNQMWCTECKVAFDWNTGTIQTNNIHNPHYYDFIRENNGFVNRNIGDVPCGGLIQYYYFHNSVIRKIRVFDSKDFNKHFNRNINNVVSQLSMLHRTVAHIIAESDTFKNKIVLFTDNKDLRAKYILNLITKESFAKTLYSNDKMRKKNQEIINVYEIIIVYCVEFFNLLVNKINENISTNGDNKIFNEKSQNVLTNFYNFIDDYLLNLSNLFNYCNKQLSIISGTYNLTVIQIKIDTFEFQYKKFKLSDTCNK